MGGGSSTAKKYVLRTVDEEAAARETVDSPQKGSRGRKQTAIYPTEQESADSLDSKPRLGRRASAPVLVSTDPSAGNQGPGGATSSKKAALARTHSRIENRMSAEGKDGPTSPTPLTSSKGMLAQSSHRNLLAHGAPAPLVSQPSTARMTRSNSVANRTGTVCSLTYPWLLKSCSTSGTNLSDYEFGRIIGKSARSFPATSNIEA